MADTDIEWTNKVWNPTTGCDKVSPGCGLPRAGRPGEQHSQCYAMTMARRLKGMGKDKYQRDGDPRTSGPGFGLTVHEDMLDEPFRWRKPRRVFVDSMSDLFHPDVPDEFIARVFDVMVRTQRHTYQVLTKRPQRMAALTHERLATPDEADAGCELGLVPGVWEIANSGNVPSNVWLGTSIESDAYAWRANHLRATNAAVRFVSAEPLLGPLPSLDLEGIDWLIVGGESGPGARPMHPQWAEELRDRAVAAGTRFFFKQWGAWRPALFADEQQRYLVNIDGRVDGPIPPQGYMQLPEDSAVMVRVGKKRAGRVLDGRTWDDYPMVAV